MKALSTLLRREVEVVGAGRTDAGVHASLMVAHFDSDSPLDTVFMTDKLNRLLPPDIAVRQTAVLLSWTAPCPSMQIFLLAIFVRHKRTKKSHKHATRGQCG